MATLATKVKTRQNGENVDKAEKNGKIFCNLDYYFSAKKESVDCFAKQGKRLFTLQTTEEQNAVILQETAKDDGGKKIAA